MAEHFLRLEPMSAYHLARLRVASLKYPGSLLFDSVLLGSATGTTDRSSPSI